MSERKDKFPTGWTTCRLGDALTLINGRAYSRHEMLSAGTPILRIQNLNGGKNWFYSNLNLPPDKYCNAGDLLFAWSATFGPYWWRGPKAIFHYHIWNVLPSPLMGREFAFYELMRITSDLKRSAHGVAMPHITKGGMEAWDIMLPPPSEQKRIADKLEAVLGRVDACRARLDRVPALLKRFRQSVLAAATTGKLTEEWRETNKNVPAAEMLVKKQKFSITETDENLPTLPARWMWVALGDYAQCSRGRFSPRPRNDPRYFNGEHAFIQIGDLPREGGLVSTHTQTLNNEGLAVSKKFPKGTVVIAIVGATIGNTGILAYDMCATDSIVGLETGIAFGNRYIELFLRSRKDAIRQISYASGGQPNINLATLNPYPLPLPPLPEQQEIVRRVEALFAIADRIEARLATARKTVERLTPATLAKAFRGELVPQDPNDEPASAILERLHAQSDPAAAKPKRGRGAKSTSA